MLRLGDGKVRDGVANEVIATGRLATSCVSTEGRLCDGTGNPGVVLEGKAVGEMLSALFVGISKIGRPVGVGGKVIIGRPKESTMDGGVGIESRLGIGMENGGGPVIAGNPTEGMLRDGRVEEIGDMVGSVAEGTAIVGSVSEGELIEGTLGDGTVRNGGSIKPKLSGGRFSAGIVTEGGPILGRLSDGRPIESAVAEGAFSEGWVWPTG